MIINIYTDGGARGNPGPSAYGLHIEDEHKNVLLDKAEYIGIKTNNEAEYAGVLAALSWIKKNKKQYQIEKIFFYSDSQLLVRQLQGLYKVKAPNLKPLYIQATQDLSTIGLPYTFTDIRRHLNTIADQLLNDKLDQHH